MVSIYIRDLVTLTASLSAHQIEQYTFLLL